jgi:hypothetical protein
MKTRPKPDRRDTSRSERRGSARGGRRLTDRMIVRANNHPAAADQSRLKIKIPECCPFCGTVGHVTIETTVRGSTALLTWCCRKCSHEWPIADHEIGMIERAQSQYDHPRMLGSRYRGK